MKKLIRPAVATTLIIFFIVSCMVIALSTPPSMPISASAGGLFAQITPTPLVEEDLSEVGSTDEIIVMGMVIVAIVLTPIVLQRKVWMQKDNS
jgi:hypothetical protein